MHFGTDLYSFWSGTIHNFRDFDIHKNNGMGVFRFYGRYFSEDSLARKREITL